MNHVLSEILDKNEKIMKIKNYYEYEKLEAYNFDCKFFNECSNSNKSLNLVKQYSGGVCGIMPFFDTNFLDNNIRVLIIGKETGYMQNEKYGVSKDYNDNFNKLIKCINWTKKNNHMKGTHDTLKYIFDMDSEYILANYALTNLLRCSFQEKNIANNVSNTRNSKKMNSNCMTHLLKEINILEPTLIISQGEWAIKNQYLKSELELYYNEKSKIIMETIPGKYGLYKYSNFFLLTTHHPAIYGNWKKNLAPITLWPCLDYLKNEKILPKYTLDQKLNFEKNAKKILDPILNSLPSNDKLRSKIEPKLF